MAAPPDMSAGTDAAPASLSRDLGWFPLLTMFMGVGLLVMAVAFEGGRHGAAWAIPAFWSSVLLILVPPSARILAPSVSRTERLGIVLALGITLYVAAVLRNPTNLTGYDDLLNLRTALDILATGRLFTENPLLIVNALYPALGSVAAAFSQVSGLDPFATSVVVMGTLRVLLVLGLFLLFEVVSGSAWVGAVAALVYAANPDFIYFNSSYVYESFALPFAIVTLWVLAERQSAPDRRVRVGLTVVALIAIGCVITGHHLTAIALAGALVLWAITRLYRRLRGDDLSGVQGVAGMAAITILAGVLWTAYVATEMLKYLGSLFLSTLNGAIGFLTGAGGRTLFGSSASTAPLEERVVSLAATAIVVVLLPIGLVILLRTLGRRPAALMLGIIALGYPAAQVLRLTSSGGLEVASRSSSYVFVGVAFTLALVAVSVLGRWRAAGGVIRAVALSLLVVLFAGGVVLGSAWWSRFPGPFLVGGDSRSISPEGLATAIWMRDYLGPNQRVAADRTNRVLVGSTGRQRVVFDARDPVGLLPLFAEPTLDPAAKYPLTSQSIRYVLVDRRLSTAVPVIGLYYDQEEVRHPWTAPIPAASLAKFDSDPRFGRVYDNGVIQLYDAQVLLDE